MTSTPGNTRVLPPINPAIEENTKRRPSDPSRLIPLIATTALGLLAVAFAFAESRANHGWAPALFWVGLLIVVGPIAFRLLGSKAGYEERLGLVLTLGLALYAVKVMHSPGGFTSHDELGQLRSTEDLLRSGQLYHPNPIVAAYAYFPGLHGVTAAFASISGLSLFASGLIMLGVARAVLMVAIFAFLERVTGSNRVAGVGALIYTANPSFLFFDAQYSYESLAIPLAAATLLATALADRRGPGRRLAAGIAVILAAGVVITHHMTTYALLAGLMIWAVVAGIRRKPDQHLSVVPLVAGATALMAGAWWLVAGNAVASDVWPSLREGVTSLWSIVSGSASAKAPFSPARGYSDPLYIKAMGIASVVCLLIALPWALLATWRDREKHPALTMLGVAALAYPATLALRLSVVGSETSNRASEFVFLGLGATFGLAFSRWLAGPTASGSAQVGLRVSATVFACIAVLGGITVGTSSTALQPGNYVVGEDSRSITPEGIAAARWGRRWLPFHSRLLTDTTNRELMTAYGLQDPQGGFSLGRPVGAIFASPSFDRTVIGMIVHDKLKYLVVDMRLSRALPRSGHYFDSGESLHEHRLSRRALLKFSHSGLLDQIYSSGNIRIYDTGPLLRADR